MTLIALLFLATNYVTYLGGTGGDVAAAMAVDYAGSVYVSGTSSSSDFPVTSTSLGGPSAGHHCGFIAKLTPDGNALDFSICIPDLTVNAFALDPSGGMYLAATNLDNSQSVLKLDRNAQTIVYTVPFQNNRINAIAADPYGTVYVAGSSISLTTTPGVYQQRLAQGTCRAAAGLQLIPVPCEDIVVAKLARDGSLIYATYLGGSGNDNASAIAIDAFGDAWITGTTASPDLPVTLNALQKQFHGEVDSGPVSYGDAFVAELDPLGSKLLYSSYLGGSFPDGANAIAVDGVGSVYIAGFTQSPDFPVSPGVLQPSYIGSAAPPGTSGNGFLTKLDAGGNLVFSTLLGSMGSPRFTNEGSPIGGGNTFSSTITSLAINSGRQAIANIPGAGVFILDANATAVVCQQLSYGPLIANNGSDTVYSFGQFLPPSVNFLSAHDLIVQASDSSRCY